MAEVSASELPEGEAKSRHDQRIVNSLDMSTYLAETALNMSEWAPYLDWSERLSGAGVLTSPLLVDAFSQVRRYDFLPASVKPRNGEDRPLPIGYRQSNSQPSTVAQMLEWLDVQPGQKILDLGVGSGWTTALLAHAVGQEGVVHGTERIPELVRFAKTNIGQYGYTNAVVHRTPKGLGLRSEAPYDRILVSAATKLEWVTELFNRQLSAEGGIMVMPITDEENHGNDSHDKELAAIRSTGGEPEWLQRRPGYAFVPLVLPEDR